MLILGKEVSRETRIEIKPGVEDFSKKYGRVPCLAVIIVFLAFCLRRRLIFFRGIYKWAENQQESMHTN